MNEITIQRYMLLIPITYINIHVDEHAVILECYSDRILQNHRDFKQYGSRQAEGKWGYTCNTMNQMDPNAAKSWKLIRRGYGSGKMYSYLFQTNKSSSTHT
jgi:hypothetical protein